MTFLDKYTADFETTTDINDCRVWAWGVINIDTQKFNYGNSIESFFSFIYSNGNSTYYFHNLKFDGEFIIYYLLTTNFKWINNKKLKNNEFTTLINMMNQFYQIKVKYNNIEIIFLDSLKILPFSVDKIAQGFKLNIRKLEIDYNAKRLKNHKLTKKEIKYLENDCRIMSEALKITFSQGDTKMTAGANALKAYKSYIDNWDYLFPILDKETHENIRLSYKGGYVYCNKKGDFGEGIVLDVNSLYPSVMYNNPYPYGLPLFFKGEYIKDSDYPLYIQQISCQFELKEGYLPTIQLKNGLGFNPVEYLKSSNNEIITMTLTCIDLEIFFEHYNVYNLDFICGYKFKAMSNMFNNYIDFYMEIKSKTKGPLRELAKLKLNSLYGKFATGIDVTGKHPILKDGCVSYVKNEKEERKPIYMPVGTFVTAYARKVTISSAQACYDRLIYTDTDSLHLKDYEIPSNIEIHDTKLGAWKIENKFNKARFIKPKTYYEEGDNVVIKCAGMPDNIKRDVNWDNFKVGFNSNKKLKPRHVPGGIVLVESPFKIH